MKQNLVILMLLVVLTPALGAAQSSRAQRAWKPFITAFRAAVKKRDREAVSQMMSRDFYYLSSGGDENGNQDSRDEAFEYWETAGIGSWEELDKALAQGVVPNIAMREPGNTRPSRVAPPLANNRRAIANRSFHWYAVFEFREGRWYCIAFTECCE
jgi:hypothetical protein